MSRATPPYTDAQRREAADWFIAIRTESDPRAESIQAWLRWMDQHESNRAAFDAVTRSWHVSPSSSTLAMPSDAELNADEYDPNQSVEEWLAEQGGPATPLNAVARTKSTRRVWLAAASVLIAAFTIWIVGLVFDWRSQRSDEFVTRTGEQVEITLPDGSHVWLGPKSKLIVAFDRAQRSIQLARGEAFFAVKKDPARPFAVRSAGGDIVAVGTSFNVRAIDEHVTVAVSEGVVAVTPKTQLANQKPASVRVASGEQLTFTAQQPLKALTIVQSPAPGDRARWRDGVLVYRNEPLREVVSDVVRYSDIQIEIVDPVVGDMHFSGVIYHDAVREWVAALPESFPVSVVSDGTREIIMAR